MNRVALEKHRADSLRGSVEAATLKMRFWAQLSNKVPEIGVLQELSSSIHHMIAQTTNHFEQLLALNSQSVSTYQAFAAFQQARAQAVHTSSSCSYTNHLARYRQ